MKKIKKTQAANGELPIERVPLDARKLLRAAPSLRPGPAMMEAAAAGNPEAQAVRDAWRFSYPVRIVNAEDFAAICKRGEMTFNG